MDINNFITIVKDLAQKYKKILLLGIGGLIGLLLLIFVVSSIISIWDQSHAIYYEVTFHTNGGTIVNTQKVRKGRTINDSIKTEKPGFDFIGWEYEGKKFDLATPIKEDINLSARWEENGSTVVHTVQFETYGGTTIEPFQVSQGKTFTKPSNPMKDGYQFLGWYLGDEPYNFIKTAVPSDITLKAKWERMDYLDENQRRLERSALVFSNLRGTWYLKDYEDIYITFTEEDNGFGRPWYFLKWYNIDLVNQLKQYPKGLYQRTISIEKADFYEQIGKFYCYIENEELIFEQNGKKYFFTRIKGNKNKYTDTLYKKSIGRWFLENSYSSYIDITSNKTDNILDYDSYCIHTTNINLGTLQLGSSMEYGCLKAFDETLFQELGIKIDDDVMTVQNENGMKRFTLNRVVSEGSVTGIEVDKVAAKVQNGGTTILFVTVTPREASNTKVIWESSDPSVASVIGNPNVITTSAEGVRYSGTVKAHKAGTATITIKTVDGGHIATSKITVPEINVNAINLNKRETTIYVGNFEQLKATVIPSNASNQRLVWSSSNPNVAIVNENGNVQGIKEGTTMITVSTEDGQKRAVCTINVKYMTLNVVTAINDTTKLQNGNYVKGIGVTVTASGGSGIYSSYQIKLYYNHQLVKEEYQPSLFYPTELKGNYYAEIIVVDSEGNRSTTTKELIRN